MHILNLLSYVSGRNYGYCLNHKEHKEELFFFFVLFAVKENCHGGTETRRREKKFFLCDSVAKAFMTEGGEPSS